MRFYLASSIDSVGSGEFKAARDALVSLGHELTFDWSAEVSDERFNSREEIEDLVEREVAGVKSADFVVVLLPAGRGTHIEIGMALALGIPVFLVVNAALSTAGDFKSPDTVIYYWQKGVEIFDAVASVVASEAFQSLHRVKHRRAPVQSDRGCQKPSGTISWEEHEEIYEKYAVKFGRSQTAERIAERGGFGYGEIHYLTGKFPKTWEPLLARDLSRPSS